MTTVNLSWDAVTLDDSGAPINISGYNLYADGVLLLPGLTGLSVTTNQQAGTTVQYSVTAISDLGVEGAQSTIATVATPSGIPNAPGNFTATI